MLVVAAFFGGIRLERERRRRADEAAAVAAAAKNGQPILTPLLQLRFSTNLLDDEDWKDGEMVPSTPEADSVEGTTREMLPMQSAPAAPR